MDKPIKISVVTVVYNAFKELNNTFKSIREQDYSNIEYIVIDGKSTDGTINLIKQNTDIVNTWISEPDSGIYDAMNKGIALSTGDYIWFLNAGDLIFSPSTISNMFTLSGNINVFYGGAMIIDSQGKDIGLRRLKPNQNLTWKDYKWGQLICHQSFIAKKSIIEPYNLTYKFSADTDWQIRILKKSKPSQIVDTNLILSKFLDGGYSKKTILPSLRDRFKIMINYYGLLTTIINHFIIGARFFKFYLLNKRF